MSEELANHGYSISLGTFYPPIEGMERMRLVRDDIKSRVRKLFTELVQN